MNYSDPMGSEEFREVIAAYLRTARAVHCEASQIMVVNGSQHALDLSARVLLDPDSPVWIEEPGYEFLRHALTLSGCRLVPVPVDGEGLDVAAGIKLCRERARSLRHTLSSVSARRHHERRAPPATARMGA